MKYSLRAMRTAVVLFASTILLAGCGALEPLKNAVIPDFSDEQLGNPMAGFVPSGGGVPVQTQASPGLAFSATQPVGNTASVSQSPQPLAATGLFEQAATSGVSSADAALLDAALDVSPSQMGNSGASVGLVADSLNGFVAPEAMSVASLGAIPRIPAPLPTGSMARAPIVSSLDTANAGFEVLSAADAQILIAGREVIKYTNRERADMQTPYFAGRANAISGLAPTPGFTAVGTSPAVAVNVPDAGPNSTGTGFELETIPRATLRTNQAAIPIYGGSQPLAQRPTSGVFRSGYAQFRSGDVQFTLTYPTQVAISQLYAPTTGGVTMTMQNLGSVPISFQPENLLNRFPPFEVFRWTGSVWASLTMDVAYNLDRQGIAAPVTLQPGQSTTRREDFAKLALLPLKADLPPTSGLAIRLRVLGQGGAFGNVDSGYLPIRVTDSGAFPTATNLTASADPGFVVLDGSVSIPGTIVTR